MIKSRTGTVVPGSFRPSVKVIVAVFMEAAPAKSQVS